MNPPRLEIVFMKKIGILTLGLLAATMGLPGSVSAQPAPDVHELDFDRPESWAMARTISLTLFTAMGHSPGAPLVTSPQTEFSLEAGWIPHLSRAERTVGFDGTEAIDLNKFPVIGRLRFNVYFPRGITLETGLIPPLEMSGTRPAIVGLAVGWRGQVAEGVRGFARIHGQRGHVRGDIVCPQEAAANRTDPELNPLRCQRPSRDQASPDYVGVEVGATRAFGPWIPHLAASVQRMEPKFEISAQFRDPDTLELVDERGRLETQGTGWSMSAGVTRDVVPGLPVTMEVLYAPLNVRRTEGAERTREGVWNMRLILRHGVG